MNRFSTMVLATLLLALALSVLSHDVNAAPTVIFVYPRQQGAYNSTTIEANWTVDDEHGNITCEYRLDQGTYWNIGDRTNVTLTDLLEGYHVLDLRVTNGMGQDTETGVSFWIDTVSPNVQFTHEGTFYTNLDPVMIEWAATDSGSGVDHIETRIDGGPWEEKGNVNRQIVTLGTDDVHLFEVKVYDNAGNSWMAGKELVLDTIKPEVELISPIDGSILNGSTIDLEWTGSDEGSGISYYEVQFDSLTPEIQYQSGTMTFENRLDGRHEIRITAFDLSGNLRTVTASIEIDTLVPSVANHYPGDWEVEIDPVIWITTSEMLVPDTVSFIVTGVPGNVTFSGGQISFIPDFPLEYGTTYFVHFEGMDRAGNSIPDHNWNFTTTDIGNLIGSVVDPFGNPIPGARVDLEKIESDRTNGLGEFNLSHNEGTYWLNASKVGYHYVNTTVTIIAGNFTDLGWITLHPIEVETSIEEGSRIIMLLVSILVLVFLIFLMVSFFIFKRHKSHGISHEDREQMLEILRHFDVSTRIHEIDCYEILGVERKVTKKEIKKAYRNLAAKYHPDRMMHTEGFDEDMAHDRMREINAAKNILMDDEKRDLHDRILKVTKRY